jgi:hypothetical protein
MRRLCGVLLEDTAGELRDDLNRVAIVQMGVPMGEMAIHENRQALYLGQGQP